MKIKVKTDDFKVSEVLDLDVVHGAGKYSIYKIEKWGTNTLDVINDIAKRLRIPRHKIGYGGLKDRYAYAIQYISIPDGGLWRIKAKNYIMEFIGRSDKPVSKSVLCGNDFSIIVRDINPNIVENVNERLKIISQQGFVNYFDEQRFSSARHGKGFVAHKVILGDYAGALKLLFMASAHDNSRERKFKRCVQQNWGDWEKCIDMAPSEWQKRVLSHMAKHKRGYKKALELVDKEFLFLLGTAFQAFVWNRVAKEYIKSHTPKDYIIIAGFKLGETLYYIKSLPKELIDKIHAVIIPLPSPKLKLEGELERIYSSVLSEMGIHDISNFRSKVTGLFFRTSGRKLVVIPENLSWDWCEDEMYQGREKLVINTFLPKGSYITMLIKQAFLIGKRGK